MRAIVCHTEDPDSEDAAIELIESARARLDGQTPKGALLFMSVEYEHDEILRALLAEWPGLQLIGGSTDGELTSEHGFIRDSVALTLLVGDDIEIRTGLATDLSKDTDKAVDRCLADIDGTNGKLCITVFAPSANSTAVLQRLDAKLGNTNCPVLGGLTGDHREFARTREFFGGDVHSDSITTMVIEGDIQVGWGIGTGWFPMGEALEVTAADGHVVAGIDTRPALQFYEDHWGSLPTGSLGEYPLAVFPEGRDGDYFLRAALDSDRTIGSIRFAGDVPAGSVVTATEVLPEGILSGSEESVARAIQSYPGERPELALIFSCAARKWVLGTRAEEEINLLTGAFADKGLTELPLAGFYCYGEIAPFAAGEPSRFHNESCVTVLIGS